MILAVVLLLEATGCVEDGGTSCEVTEVTGPVATLDCRVMKCSAIPGERGESKTFSEHHFNNGPRNTTINDSSTRVSVSSEGYSRILQKESLMKETINLTLHDTYKRNETVGDHNFESNDNNATWSNVTSSKHVTAKLGFEESWLNISKTSSHDSNNSKEIQNTTRPKTKCFVESSTNSWRNITALKIHLRNTSTIDLTPFPNVTTVSVHGKNLTITKTFGVDNVFEFSAVSSDLKNISFVSYFVNLTHLNLTHNFVSRMRMADLPITITVLDLSYNNISFNTNVLLPKALRVLNISSNHISLVPNTTLEGNVRVLDLKNNCLAHFPTLIMKDLEELYLSENNISSINHKDLTNLSSLTVLDLRKNLLRELDEISFEGLNKLQQLDLSQNQIKLLSPSTFQYLNNLVLLSLSDNTDLGNLQDFKESSFLFGTGQRLQSIEACKTNLTRIPPTLTRSVRKLLLRNNIIRSIQCGELDSFPLLQNMDLSNNLVAEIEEDAFGRLDFLSHLVLYGNQLTSIPKSLPSQLQVLDLRMNLVGKLHNSDLLGLQKLKALLLSKNKIATIEDNSLGQLVSLEVLDLSHNPIKALSRTSFMGPRKLKEIYLVSLTDLIPFQEPLSFPAPESGHLEVLNMDSSPVLATQLMDDVAALTMFHELFELNLNHCRLSTLRNDLPKYLPRLHKLELSGNKLNCSNIIWLVRWLQTLNISMQESGKFRREIYNLKDICCDEVNEAERHDQASVMCSSPANLVGRQIISLKEEDFPDLKLTSSTLPPSRELLISEPYHSQTSSENTGLIDSSPTTSSTHSITETSSRHSTEAISHGVGVELQSSTMKNPQDVKLIIPSNNDIINNFPDINASHKNLTIRLNTLNTATKVNMKTAYSDPIMVLLNETKNIIRDFDNHLNDTISSGAFLAHESPRGSHPGMVLFLLLVGVVLGAASVMVYAQCAQNRRAHRQQDIEVSSLGGNELW